MDRIGEYISVSNDPAIPMKGSASMNAVSGVQEKAAIAYGPKLPEGEDGHANLDAGNKIRMLYRVGLIGIGVLALVAVLNQLEANGND